MVLFNVPGEWIIDFKLLAYNEITLKSQISCIKSLQNGYKFGNEISARWEKGQRPSFTNFMKNVIQLKSLHEKIKFSNNF